MSYLQNKMVEDSNDFNSNIPSGLVHGDEFVINFTIYSIQDFGLKACPPSFHLRL